ncbi:uncharacterized protein LOC119586145 [Penaeus monodon]|uniref:uncharacterized protein LOC119586145 n=1 Tax=Penaeus monodon TaxID=6687 RepID=UPI0018A7C3D6|nr:uncharacterized protein LOC119586145 [Penaeus monodon]
MWVEDSQKDGDGVKVKVKLKPRPKESDKSTEEVDGNSKTSRERSRLRDSPLRPIMSWRSEVRTSGQGSDAATKDVPDTVKDLINRVKYDTSASELLRRIKAENRAPYNPEANLRKSSHRDDGEYGRYDSRGRRYDRGGSRYDSSYRNDDPYRRSYDTDDRMGGRYDDGRSYSRYDVDEKPYSSRYDADDKPYRSRYDTDDKPYRSRYDTEDKPYRSRYDTDDKSSRSKYDTEYKPYRSKYDTEDKPYRSKYDSEDKPYRSKYDSKDKSYISKYDTEEKPYRSKYDTEDKPYRRKYKTDELSDEKKDGGEVSSPSKTADTKETPPEGGEGSDRSGQVKPDSTQVEAEEGQTTKDIAAEGSEAPLDGSLNDEGAVDKTAGSDPDGQTSGEQNKHGDELTGTESHGHDSEEQHLPGNEVPDRWPDEQSPEGQNKSGDHLTTWDKNISDNEIAGSDSDGHVLQDKNASGIASDCQSSQDQIMPGSEHGDNTVSMDPSVTTADDNASYSTTAADITNMTGAISLTTVSDTGYTSTEADVLADLPSVSTVNMTNDYSMLTDSETVTRNQKVTNGDTAKDVPDLTKDTTGCMPELTKDDTIRDVSELPRDDTTRAVPQLTKDDTMRDVPELVSDAATEVKEDVKESAIKEELQARSQDNEEAEIPMGNAKNIEITVLTNGQEKTQKSVESMMQNDAASKPMNSVAPRNIEITLLTNNTENSPKRGGLQTENTATILTEQGRSSSPSQMNGKDVPFLTKVKSFKDVPIVVEGKTVKDIKIVVEGEEDVPRMTDGKVIKDIPITIEGEKEPKVRASSAARDVPITIEEKDPQNLQSMTEIHFRDVPLLIEGDVKRDVPITIESVKDVSSVAEAKKNDLEEAVDIEGNETVSTEREVRTQVETENERDSQRVKEDVIERKVPIIVEADSITLERNEEQALGNNSNLVQDSNGDVSALCVSKGRVKASTPSSRFHEAASSGDVTTMMTLVTEGGIDVDIADDRERTALHVAADRGQLPAVSFLIEQGCSINQTDSGRRTALHYAVEVGAVEVVGALLEAGAEADVREKARGRTPLHLATVTNSLEILKLLLKPLLEDPWHARSVLKVADKDGLTLLHLAAHGGLQEATQILLSAGAEVNITDQAGYTPMHAAILSRQRKVRSHGGCMELLLDAGGDLRCEGGAEFATLPHAAASVGCTRCLGVLSSRGADLDCKDSSGRTPLHFAVEFEHPETVSFLLGRNADAEAEDKRANRPLHYAIGTDSPRLVASVLEASPRGDARDRDGRTYFQHAVERRKYRALAVLAKHGITAVADDQPAMHYCASAGSQAAIEVLLENDHDINATDDQGRTPMHQAICAGHESLVNFLLSSGGSIRRADKTGATPLHYGVRWGGSDALLRRLVKGGSVTAVDRLGRTPLHYAASKSSVMSDMYILINNGAPLNTQDNRGLTPLHLASRLGNESLVRILLDNNARHDILDVDNFLPIDHAKEKGHICIINRLESYAAKKEREKDPRFGIYTRRKDEDEVLIQSRYKTNIPWYGSGKKGSDSPEL